MNIFQFFYRMEKSHKFCRRYIVVRLKNIKKRFFLDFCAAVRTKFSRGHQNTAGAADGWGLFLRGEWQDCILAGASTI